MDIADLEVIVLSAVEEDVVVADSEEVIVEDAEEPGAVKREVTTKEAMKTPSQMKKQPTLQSKMERKRAAEKSCLFFFHFVQRSVTTLYRFKFVRYYSRVH